MGTYYLEETAVPAGYNAPAGMFILTIAENDVSLGSAGTIGQADLNDWITASEIAVSEPEEGEETVYTVSIRNTVGYALHSTGGPGTKLIYLLGIMLTVLAGAGYVIKSLRRNER